LPSCLLLIGLFAISLGFSFVFSGVIKQVTVNSGLLTSTITLKFEHKVKIVNYFPQRIGKRIVLRLKNFVGGKAFNKRGVASKKRAKAFNQIDQVYFNSTDIIPLSFIRFNGSLPANKELVFYFTRQVRFKVLVHDNSKEITIVLSRTDKSIVGKESQNRETQSSKNQKSINQNSQSRNSKLDKKSNAGLGRFHQIKQAFCINLRNSYKRITLNSDHITLLNSNYILYSKSVLRGRELVYQLKVGLFSSKHEAEKTLAVIKKKYIHAKVISIDSNEIGFVKNISVKKQLANSLRSYRRHVSAPRYRLTALVSLKYFKQKADSAFSMQNYVTALVFYTKILRYKENKFSRHALGRLGAIRHRLGQLEYAQFEYRLYLKRYPYGKTSKRIAKKLKVLIGLKQASIKLVKSKTVKLKPIRLRQEWHLSSANKKPLLKSKVVEPRLISLNESINRQSFSENYTTQLNNSLVVFNNSLSFNRKNEAPVFFAESYWYNAYSADRYDDWRIPYLYYEAKGVNGRSLMRVGRQYQDKGGVLGRFDGLSTHYNLSKKISFNFVSGFPTLLDTGNEVRTQTRFVGINLNLINSNKSSQFNVFFNQQDFTINQYLRSNADRSTLGAQYTYDKDGKVILLMIGSDSLADQLDTIILKISQTTKSNVFLAAVADIRRGPLLMSSNAFYGLPPVTATEIKEVLGIEQIQRLAYDHSYQYASLTLSTVLPLSHGYRLGGDVVIANIDRVESVAGNRTSINRKLEYYYTVRLMRNNLFFRNDTNTLAFRVSNTLNYDRTNIIFDSYLPLTARWSLNPRLVLEKQVNLDQTEYMGIQPMLRFDYKVNRQMRIELDSSYSISKYSTATNRRLENELFFNIRFISDRLY